MIDITDMAYTIMWRDICDILKLSIDKELKIIEMYSGQTILIETKNKSELIHKQKKEIYKNMVRKGYKYHDILKKMKIGSKEYNKLKTELTND